MSLYAAFLRGMNIGGRRISNDELRAHFTTMGFADVATFRASGNVVFAGKAQPPDAVKERIETGLEKLLGYAVPTFVRTAAEVQAIAAATPFDTEQLQRSAGKLQVVLLGAAPSHEAQADALALAGDTDGLVFDGREVYWLPSGGVLVSSLDMTSIARVLGQTTIRTKGTVEQIAAKHLA
jgi:uncharacterized protein (DUF1697 family)